MFVVRCTHAREATQLAYQSAARLLLSVCLCVACPGAPALRVACRCQRDLACHGALLLVLGAGSCFSCTGRAVQASLIKSLCGCVFVRSSATCAFAGVPSGPTLCIFLAQPGVPTSLHARRFSCSLLHPVQPLFAGLRHEVLMIVSCVTRRRRHLPALRSYCMSSFVGPLADALPVLVGPMAFRCNLACV